MTSNYCGTHHREKGKVCPQCERGNPAYDSAEWLVREAMDWPQRVRDGLPRGWMARAARLRMTHP